MHVEAVSDIWNVILKYRLAAIGMERPAEAAALFGSCRRLDHLKLLSLSNAFTLIWDVYVWDGTNECYYGNEFEDCGRNVCTRHSPITPETWVVSHWHTGAEYNQIVDEDGDHMDW